ncbi:MAG TPA: tetratricopeptide repeat protein [Stenomitos sp.]
MSNGREVLFVLMILSMGCTSLPPVLAQVSAPSSDSAKQSVSAYVRQGDNAYAEGNYKAAIERYSQALAAYQLNDYVYYNRGNAYRKLKDYKLAIADYNQAIQLNSQNTFAYLYRGMSYQASGQPEAAIADYTTLIKLNAQEPMAYIRRAEAYLALNQRDTAVADFETAADLYKKQRKPEQADKVLSQIRALK